MQNKPAFAAKLPAEQLAEAAADHPEELIAGTPSAL